MLIAIYLLDRFETFHRRPMIEALARQSTEGTRVLCVEPPVSLGGLLRWMCSRSLRGRLSFGRPRRLTENLYVVTPLVISPSNNMWWAEGGVDGLIATRVIRRCISDLSGDSERIVAWIYRPEQYPLIGKVGEDRVIYECYDEYQRDYDDNYIGDAYEKLERSLLEEADLVFATAPSLIDARKSVRGDIRYAPNGVDYDVFGIEEGSRSMPEDMISIPHPRVMYAGGINHYLDYELMEKLLCDRPYSLVAIGSLDKQHGLPEAVLNHKRFYYLGYKSRDEVPAYLRCADATIIPYRKNEFNENRNPLKLWEYLAAGRPAVVTRTRFMSDLDGVVYAAGSHEEFMNKLDQALGNDNQGRIRNGRELARRHSWDGLVRTMLGEVEGVL